MHVQCTLYTVLHTIPVSLILMHKFLCSQLEQRIAAESHGTAAVREERVRLEEQMAAAEGTRKVLEAQIQQFQVETHSIIDLLYRVNSFDTICAQKND